MTEEYTPSPAEEMVAQHIDGLIDCLLEGKLTGIGVCAVDTKGEPCFFYLNKPEQPVLRVAMNRLMGLYEAGQNFKTKCTAPKTNRSYRSH